MLIGLEATTYSGSLRQVSCGSEGLRGKCFLQSKSTLTPVLKIITETQEATESSKDASWVLAAFTKIREQVVLLPLKREAKHTSLPGRLWSETLIFENTDSPGSLTWKIPPSNQTLWVSKESQTSLVCQKQCLATAEAFLEGCRELAVWLWQQSVNHHKRLSFLMELIYTNIVTAALF